MVQAFNEKVLATVLTQKVLFVIASSVTSPLIPHNSPPCSVEDKYILKLGLERTFTQLVLLFLTMLFGYWLKLVRLWH